MLKASIKILLSTLTIFVVLFAVLLTLARIGSVFAPNFVNSLNQQFAEQGLNFADLKVRWRGINLVIELGQVTSKNLLAEDITAELDTLASFWRNTYVFRTIQINHVSVELTQNSACAITLPSVADGSFGIGAILRYSGNIDISFSSSVECGSVRYDHEGFFRTIRIDNVNRMHASIRDLGACDTCYISLLYETNTTGYWIREEERILNVQAHDFVIPTSLLGWEFMSEPVMNAQILMSGTSEDATLVGDIDLHPGRQSNSPQALSLELSSSLKEAFYSGKVVATLFDINSNVVSSVEHFVQRDSEAGYVHGWSFDVPAETINAFLAIFGNVGHPIYEKVVGLEPTGRVSILQWVHDRTGFKYWTSLDDFRIQQFGGLPSLVLDSTNIAGRGALVHVIGSAQQVNIAEAEYIHTPLTLTEVDFSTVAVWKQDYFGYLIDGGWVPESDHSEIEFKVKYQDNVPVQRQWFRIALEIPSISATQARSYLASFIPATAFSWIEQSVQQAQFNQVKVELARVIDELHQVSDTSFEVQVPFVDADVIFDRNWPEIVQGKGLLWLNQDELAIEVDSAYSQGNHIEQGQIHLPFSTPVLDLKFTADMSFLLLQSYLAESPLIKQLNFDPLQVDGNGSIDLVASLQIPLNDEYENSQSAELELVFSDVFVDFKAAGIQLDDIFGRIGYSFPNQFTSSQLTGKFLENPVVLDVVTRTTASGSDEVAIAFELDTTIRAMSTLTGDWLRAIAQGSMHASGEIIIPFTDKSQPTIRISTNLVGVELMLPAPFHKEADLNRNMQLLITLADPLTIGVEMDELSVHTVISKGSSMRGSVGLNVTPLDLNESTRDWLVAGNLEELVFVTDQSSDSTLPEGLDIEFSGLQVNKLIRGRFQLHDLLLDGTIGGDSSSLAVSAEEGNATLERDLGQRWQLSVGQLRLWHSAFETTNDAPMDPTAFLALPSVDVSVQELYMFAENGEPEEFGNWTFSLDTTDTAVHLSNIVAELRGVSLDTRDNYGIIWDTNKNETQFSGVIRGTNLLQVLPEFDVEAEIESKDFTVYSDLRWPGSPFDVNTLKMSGRIHGDANEGTLLEVEAGQGILRLLSVFNIAPIIQRVDFDPTAVFAKGFNFDRIMFDVTLDQSELIIQEPIHIKGRSSEVLFSGNANLVDESLTMDVVVRLPFSNNLKWYVALITGNPTAFLGTMIGSRIFQRQLDRISSAKYRVGGTFTVPEVEFIGVFDDDLTQEQPDAINEE